MGPIRFESPFWLLLLPLAAYSFWMWQEYSHRAARGKSARTLSVMRALAVVCLVLALAQATVITRVPGIALHILVDRSASISSESQAARDLLLTNLQKNLGPHDTATVYSFGKETFVEPDLLLSRPPFTYKSLPDETGTNIESALRTALQHVDRRSNARILLVSDGMETVGDAEEVIASARARQIPIDAYPLTEPPGDEVTVEQMLLPTTITPSEPYVVRAVISSTAANKATLDLYKDGELVGSRSVDLGPGRTLFTFDEFTESAGETVNNLVRFELRIRPTADTLSENNVGYGVVRLQNSSSLLLLTADLERSSGLQEALRSQGMQVDLVDVRRARLDTPSLVQYRAIIADNIPARLLSQTQMENLSHYVEETGGGLLVTGGNQSFGLGEYAKTPLEAILPVAMDAPQDVIMPSLAMLLTLDRSGSMAETQGAFSKLDLAKEAALGVLEVIQSTDLLGVLAFDSEIRWVVPVKPVQNRTSFAAAIASLAPEGGTSIEPALQEAKKALIKADAAVKHVIILSDGRSTPGDFEKLTKALRSDGVTVSTVGIGRDADQELLGNIAKWGNGRFYYTEDIHAIPQIFATETMMVSRPIRVDDPFVPKWKQTAEFFPEERPLPPLGGYVITTAKSAAAVHLVSPDDTPILTTWRHGLGRTAAFTAATAGPWAGEWTSWTEYPAFWGQLMRWLMRPTPAEGLLPQLTVEGGWGYLTVDAVDSSGRFVNFLDLGASVKRPTGETLRLDLSQTGPGRYGVRFPTREQGIYTATVKPTPSEGKESPALTGVTSTGAVLSYPDEYRVLNPDNGLLFRLAGRTGGAVIAQPTSPELQTLFTHPHPLPQPYPLSPWLLIVALGLFFADILLRYVPERGLVERIAGAGRRVRDQAGWDADAPSPEERLEELMRQVEDETDQDEEQRSSSYVSDTARSASAGRYLAQRKRRSPEEDHERPKEDPGDDDESPTKRTAPDD